MSSDYNASLTLEQILCLPRWTPFSYLGPSPESDRFVQEFLYRLADNIHLCLSPINGKSFEEEGGPFMTGILWGCDEGAVKRAWSMDIESDQGATSVVPVELLPPSVQPTYGSILLGLKRTNPRVCIETATYRIATDGLFAFRSIQTEKFDIYFRSPAHDDLEAPFAVLRKLEEFK
jgi:hypothetical protein